jgi:hypothetical protein
MVANSLADRMITTETDVAAIKAVTDNIPDDGQDRRRDDGRAGRNE